MRRGRLPRLGLGAKMALMTVGSLMVLLTSLGFFVIRQSRHSQEQLIMQSEDRMGDLIRRATRSAMLRNDRAELQAQLPEIGRMPQLQRVRIYDKTGTIRYSSNPEEVGEQVDMSADACDRCHSSAQPLTRLERPDRVRIYRQGGHRIMGMIHPIPNGPDCSNAACHVHPADQAVLGVLDVQMSLAQVDATIASGTRSFVLTSILVLIGVSLLALLWVWRSVHRPVQHLIRATRAISAGNFDEHVPNRLDNDLSELVHSFNQMTTDLKAARGEAEQWARTLELRVEEKSAALRRAQDEMVQVEKMASLGKLAAIVAHEINNPLAGIRTYAKLLLKRMGKEAAVPAAVGPETAAVAPQPAKAGGPPDAAGPPEGAASRAGGAGNDTREWIARIESEAARCGEIVRNLLAFSRNSQPRVEPTDLNAVITQSLRLVQHQLDLSSVETEWAPAPDVPRVEADPQQLKQALLAILINACEAMPQGGLLSIRCRPGFEPVLEAAGRAERSETGAAGTAAGDGSSEPVPGVEITIRDTGVGMDPETVKHVFEPFFTTKDGTATGGTGLGLAVVYTIIHSHGGAISVESTPGGGSVFTLFLPRVQSGTAEKGSEA